MNIIEISQLIKILQDEIKNGIDVEFNKQWIEAIINGIKNRRNETKIKNR